MMTNQDLWRNALVEIELEVSKANFNTWFKNTFISRQEDGVVYLSVPNQFVKDWLSTKYHSFILKYLRKFGDGVRAVEYTVNKDRDAAMSAQVFEATQTTTELPLKDHYINKQSNLNPRYVFDSFVVGPFNELAHAAAQQIVENPGNSYNPLLVYGKTGVGKTHLIQAIGNEIAKRSPGKKIYYVTSERFAVDLVNSIQSNNVNSFKERYRKNDVLILDDIQFLSKKEKTQEELFHLFNSLYDSNKQIVFSSDKHVNYIPDLEDRLKSRFGAGMIIDIQIPDHESRMAIIKSKSEANNIELADEIFQYLASYIEGNIRDLEGILNSIIFHSRLKGRALSINEVKNLIKHSIKPKKRMPVKDVVKIISEFYNIEEGLIYKKTRKKEVVRPRQFIMYLLREDFDLPYPSIGQALGGRDHTTVIHSYEKVKKDLSGDSGLGQEIDQLRALLQ
jgi:chromosomal replication initiator protein